MARRQNLRNIAWSILLFWSRFGINAFVFVVIARWIPIEEVGAYGTAFAIVQIFQAVQASGLPEAVIQSDDTDQRYWSTAFWMSVLLGIAFSLLLFLAAPLIGSLSGSPEAEEYSRWLAIIPAVIGVGAVHEGIIRKRLDLARLTQRTGLSLSVAGVLAIVLAAYGWGGWALIALTFTNNGLASLFNILMSGWRPSLRLDLGRVLPIASAAANIAGRNVVKASINPTNQFIVTMFLGTAAGGVYLLAIRAATILSSLSLMPAQYAALPMFSKVRFDAERRKRALHNALSVMSVLVSPIYIGAAAILPAVLPFLIGPTADDVAPVLAGLLLYSPALVLTNIAVPALVGIGQARAPFRFTVSQALLNLPVTLAAAQVSVATVGLGYAVPYYLSMPWVLGALRKDFALPVRQALAAIFRPWIAAALMGLAVRALPAAWSDGTAPSVVLASQVALGALLFPLLLVILDRPGVRNTLDLVRSRRTSPKG